MNFGVFVVCIPNSSMELDGAGWSGTVDGGKYHCQLPSYSGTYKYRADCAKSGGSDSDFASTTAAMCMGCT